METTTKKIGIASDHAGFQMKEFLVGLLSARGYDVYDFGTSSEDSCDYPDYAAKAAKAVASGECERGIVVCTTGIGISIAATKVKGIRCALLSDVMSARMTRDHNDTNMMAMGAFIVGKALALQIVDTWLGTEFSHDARHQRRIDKMMALEK